MLYHILYKSQAIKLITIEQLKAILVVSRKRNASRSITGVLLYKEGNFMQLLEGDIADVNAIYASILKDPRHKSIQLLSHGAMEQRNFPNWSMGLCFVNTCDFEDIPGFRDLDAGAHFRFQLKSSNHPSMQLLKDFYDPDILDYEREL
jgi:hypothetical protein